MLSSLGGQAKSFGLCLDLTIVCWTYMEMLVSGCQRSLKDPKFWAPTSAQCPQTVLVLKIIVTLCLGMRSALPWAEMGPAGAPMKCAGE